MKKIGIFYGSTTGTTETLASTIADALGVDSADVHNVSDLNDDEIAKYDVLLLGTSTWGAGDLQDDWYDGLDTLKAANLEGKTIALFGCGDCESYADTFCGAMGQIYDALQDKGAKFVGSVPTDGYNFEDSEAAKDGHFVGLAIDDVNESDKTEERVANWVNQLKEELA